MKLFGHPESGHAYKVKLCLTVADIPHEYEVIDIFSARENRAKEFRHNAKFHEVPLLIEQNQAFTQSNAILLHIAFKYKVLGGQEQVLFNRCKEWLFWEANKLGMCLPQLRADKKFSDSKLNDAVLQWLLRRYEHDINILETELSDGRSYILGKEPSIADFSLCGYLYFADEAHVKVPKYVQAWLQRISALHGWKHPYQLMS